MIFHRFIVLEIGRKWTKESQNDRVRFTFCNQNQDVAPSACPATRARFKYIESHHRHVQDDEQKR